MPNVFDIEPAFIVQPGNSYLAAYPHLLEYFASKAAFSEADFVCGAHLVYAWMPTVLELLPQRTSFAEAAALMTMAKQTGHLKNDDLLKLAGVVNNSVVGASKLLHFVDPAHFPIWDSRIYEFVHQRTPHHYRVNRLTAYRDYIELVQALEVDPRMSAFLVSVSSKVGYPVSGLRALELVMFQFREKTATVAAVQSTA